MLNFIEPGDPSALAADFPDASLRLLHAAAAAKQPLEPVMESIVRKLGFETFLYCTSTDARPRQDSRNYCWTNLPREWVQLYDKRAFVEVDPRMTMAWGRSTPFVWDSTGIVAEGRVREFLDSAAKYGIRSGVGIALTDANNVRYGVAFNSSISPVSEDRHNQIEAQLGNLMLLAAGLHEFFMAHVVDRGLPPVSQGQPLSDRERECLIMAAKGMTSADIGIKLGIAERTANFHFGNLISKLGVLNRKEAIAKAITTGQIHVDPY
jgi:DNA-binding CsgD family transcriptional regulator